MNRPPSSSKLHLDPNLHILFAVTLMAIMGVASVTPAFPRIARELGVSPKEIAYLITFFTFPGVVLSPVLGVLADRFGRKRILVPSLVLFGLAGTACAFVREFDTLLALRFLQGVGAGSLGALNVTIMGDLYSGRERTTAMGYNASVLSIGTASYPLVGGALAMVQWYYPFALPILAIPVAALVLFRLKSPEPRNEQRLATYVTHVWHNIRRVQVVGLLLAGLMAFVILYGSYLTYLPFLIAESFDGTPLIIGLILAAASFSTAITSARLGSLARRFSEKRLLEGGFILYAAALVLVPIAPNIWMLLVPAVLYGIAAALNITSIISLLAGLAPMNQRAAIMSINGMVLRLGQTVGPIIMAAVLSVWGLNAVFYGGAILALGTFGIAVIMIRQPKDEEA
jgi:MFS family permease